MRTIAILMLLSIFVFQSVSVGAQEAPVALEAHEIVGVVGMGAGALFAITSPLIILDLSLLEDPLSATFYVSAMVTGLLGAFSGFGGIDNWGLSATITGGIIASVGLTAPLLMYALVPVAFMLDTIFLYGPLTDYRVSLGNLILGNNFDNIATTYYTTPEVWISLIPPTAWLLGLGIVSLVLKDSNSSITKTLNNENVSIAPVVAPGKVGLIASLRFP